MKICEDRIGAHENPILVTLRFPLNGLMMIICYSSRHLGSSLSFCSSRVCCEAQGATKLDELVRIET